MIGKIVVENLLTVYTELYYRVVFCGKLTHKLTENLTHATEKCYRKDSNTTRKNDTNINSL